MSVNPLEGASRRLPKVTHVPLAIEADPAQPGGALPKLSYVNRLNLQPGDVSAVLGEAPPPGAAPAAATGVPAGGLMALLRQFEGSPLPSFLPRASVFTAVPPGDLLDVGRRLQALREQRLQSLVAQNAPAAAIAAAQSLVNTAVVANNSFDASGAVSPVGMLNLERLEMTPAGMQRGELIATIPMAPGETTSVFQKEWSVTSQEFTSIVTDSLENYSETGVTENTELAQSTTSQVTHANQFNVNATASGGCGFVSGSTTVAFGSQDQNSQSAADSRKDAVATTKKASSRVKQEHKTSISNTTVTGTQEGSTRTISNPSANPIRIDYFSLIRKWRVRLYRYGLRMTYDIAIPEPGAALREAYAELARLRDEAGGAFVFPIAHRDITSDVLTGESEPHYLVLADQYGADVPVAPENPGPTLVLRTDYPNGGPISFQFTVPDNTWITGVSISLDATTDGPTLFTGIWFTNFPPPGSDGGSQITIDDFLILDSQGNPFLEHQSGQQTVNVELNWQGGYSAQSHVQLSVATAPTDSVMATWQAQVWNALYNAAQTNYYARQQAINARIAALQDVLDGVDTLTLRREENDEIMKALLRWLLGATFDFMPQDVLQVVEQLAEREALPPPGLQPIRDALYYGEVFADASLQLSAGALTTMYQYGEMVKFINEAIEWENLVYFLYSYFWDVPASWDFVRQLRHPDATRQAFLRAGSARVVVPVRKGFEKAWTNFVETGSPEITLGPGNPYMSIAQEIYDYDQTNYPGVPPANPAADTSTETPATVGTVCDHAHAPSTAPVTLTVESTAGFLVGYTVVIDTYQGPNTQESQPVLAIPSSTELTVAALKYAHGQAKGGFPVVQPGEAGLLIAEWNEYTPSSGTDIAVTSDLTTIV